MRYRVILVAAAVWTMLIVVRAQAGLVAHYNFDETSGTTAADSVGGINGTLQGSASFVGGGITGNAASLSTSSDGVVTMGNNFAFLTGDFSIVYWIKTTTVEADSVALSKHSAGFTNGYLMPVGTTGGGGAANKSNFTVSTLVAGGVTSTTTVNDDVWHQIVDVYSATGNHSIYVDGSPAEQTKVSAAMIGNTSPFLVGGVGTIGNPTLPDGRYTGLFDELQIYDNVLSDSDIDYLHDHPGQTVPEPTGLLLLGAAIPLLHRRRSRTSA